MAEFVNTFEKGLNLDVDYSMLPNNQYIGCDNLKISTSIGSSTGAKETVDGNYLLSDNIPSGFSLVGHCFIRDDLYLFIVNEDTNESRIIKFDIINGDSIVTTIYSDLTFTEKLNFKYNNKIKAVGRYETSEIQKIYLVDGVNLLRVINVTLDNSSISPGQLDIIPDAPLVSPTINNIASGSLLAGKYQYVYQYVNINGSETLFSSPSKLISLSTTSTLSGSNKTFKGDAKGTNTGKGINLTIPIISGYSSVRVISIRYETENTTPSGINIIVDKDLLPTDTSLNLTDYGINYVGELTYAQLSILNSFPITGSEIETKNDYLFVGNITDGTFDIDFDARAYRFYGDSITETSYKKRRHSILSTYIRTLDESDPSAIDIDGTSSLSSQLLAIPSTHNCINVDNYLWDSDDHMIYQSDGSTLGGEGLNVSYGFKTVRNTVISNFTSTTADIEEYSSSEVILVSNMDTLGYQRDEIYRFGIVFFNIKGQQSSVKWIGDIKMPKFGDVGSTFQLTAISNNCIYANDLQLSFSFNFTNAISQGASSYKLVRVQRDSVNKSVLAQGLVSGCINGYDDFSSDVTFDRSYKTAYPGVGFAPSYNYTYVNYYSNNPGYPNVITPIEFISPEVSFNKDISFNSGDLVIKYGNVTNQDYIIGESNTSRYFNNIPNIPTYEWSLLTPYSNVTLHSTSSIGINEYKEFSSQTDTYDSGTSFYNVSVPKAFDYIEKIPSYDPSYLSTTISDSFILDSADSKITTGNRLVRNKCRIVSSATGGYESDYTNVKLIRNNKSRGGTCLFAVPDHDLTSGTFTDGGLLCNYVRPYKDIYGGATYSSRSNNTYIACSDIININTNLYSTIGGGDIYISMFDYLRLFITNDDISGDDLFYWDYSSTTNSFGRPVSTNIVYFPVETQINLRYRSDYCFSKDSIIPYSSKFLMTETIGNHIFSTSNFNGVSSSFNQQSNLYIYNNIYSQENTLYTYFPLDNLTPTITNTDCRIYGSNKKQNGRVPDDWSTFPINNFIDVDSSFGKLTNLLNYKNQLYFWQERGFGVLPVEQQSLIQDNNPSGLVLGTGGVLQRYDYISTVNGCQYRFGVTDTSYGLYWYDNKNKYICKFDGQVNPISLNRINSLFINNGVSNDVDIQVNTVNNRLTNSVLFTVPVYRLGGQFSITSNNPISNTFIITINTNYNISSNFQIGEKVLVSLKSYYTGKDKVIDATITGFSTYVINLQCASKEDYFNFVYSLSDSGVYHDPISIELIKGKTLVYDEPSDSFDSFYTIFPKTLIRYDNYYLSSNDNQSLYLHNTRSSTSEYINKNIFYGISYPSKLSFIVNGNYNETKIFDRLEYHSTSDNTQFLSTTPGYTSNIISTPDTFNYIRVSNDYQNSDFIPIILNSNLTRKERGFILGIPRNKINTSNDVDIFNPNSLVSSGSYVTDLFDDFSNWTVGDIYTSNPVNWNIQTYLAPRQSGLNAYFNNGHITINVDPSIGSGLLSITNPYQTVQGKTYRITVNYANKTSNMSFQVRISSKYNSGHPYDLYISNGGSASGTATSTVTTASGPYLIVLNPDSNDSNIASIDIINFTLEELSLTRQFSERIRDKYMRVDLTYTPSTSTTHFKIPYIKTQYRISKR